MDCRVAMRVTKAGAVVLLSLLAGCAGDPNPRFAGDGPVRPVPPLPAGAQPVTPLGAYLAGRVAQNEHDLPAALAFFQEALAHAPNDPELMSSVFVLATSEGRFDIAQPLAAKLATLDATAPLPNLVLAVEELKHDHAGKALDDAKQLPSTGIYLFVGGFARAWLTPLGKGDAAKAVAELDGLDAQPAIAPLKALHAALLDDLAGDEAGAEKNYQAAIDSGAPPLRLVQLAGNFFERAGRRDEAQRLYTAFALRGQTEAGFIPALTVNGKPPRLISDAKGGFAEALFDMASVVSQADSPEVAMLNVRLALELKPDFPLASLVMGDVLETENRAQAALATYRSIDRASPYAWTARLREASVMDGLGDHDGADKLLRAMAAERPNQPEPLIELGNNLRGRDKYKEAQAAYTDAIARLGPDPDGSRYWSLYYSRGIAAERAGDWDAAEADLRKAMAMHPDQADVLNYLGYSLVDRSVQLPEAVKLIKRAVELKPKDGYIVDSLGWAYYRMGNFNDAQSTLEQAVELRPGDAEINDHLGDAYWQGRRPDDARLQWRRALSLNPEADLAKTIEGKLDHPPALRQPTTTARHGG